MGEAGGVTDGRFRLAGGEEGLALVAGCCGHSLGFGTAGWSVLHHFLNQFYSFHLTLWLISDILRIVDGGRAPYYKKINQLVNELKNVTVWTPCECNVS